MITYTVDGSSVTKGLRLVIEALGYHIAKQHGQIKGTVFHKHNIFFPAGFYCLQLHSITDDLAMFGLLTRDKNDCGKQDSGPK